MAIDGKVFELAKIIKPENFYLGKNSQVDDFCFINSGTICEIGRNVHIASFSSIIGGGECYIGDFSGLSAGCRLITGSDDFTGPYMTNPTVPAEFKNVKLGAVRIGRHAVIGTNCIVFPDVEIPDGCTVGAGSIVRKSLEPWTVYATIKGELRPIKQRNQSQVLTKEALYIGNETFE